MESAAIYPTMPPTGKVSIRFDGWEFRHALPRISDNEFEEICRKNPDLRIELDKNGNLLVMPPVSLGSGNHEIETGADLVMWNRAADLGMVFSSQTMFSLPDGAKRMADAAWISYEKLKALPKTEWDTYAHIVPDFVIEVRSPSDDLEAQQDKIKDAWLANGVRLAWLFDPAEATAYIYRADGSFEEVSGFDKKLSGEDVLPGFEFSMSVLKRKLPS
jgi:Uma2 family endonuclease